MVNARWAVIRYVPDPARNEQLNLGILVWADTDFRIGIDQRAAERIIRENPWLAKDALLSIEAELQASLDDAPEISPAVLNRFPIVMSEERHTSIKTDDGEGLNETLARLLDRAVRPRRRSGRTSERPQDFFERRFAPFVASGMVARNHVFVSSNTGVPRRVEYLANSNRNRLLEILKLDLQNADEILVRADHQAFKLDDILGKNQVQALVYCSMPQSEQLQDTAMQARKIIESVKATVLTEFEQAAGAMGLSDQPVTTGSKFRK